MLEPRLIGYVDVKAVQTREPETRRINDRDPGAARLDPVELEGIQGTVQGDDVEATRAASTGAVTRKVVLGRSQQALLFAPVDAFRGRPVGARAPVAHFDEDDAVAVLHDQVQFAAAAAIVTRERAQAALAQVAFGSPLEAGTDGGGRFAFTRRRRRHVRSRALRAPRASSLGAACR